MLSGPIKRNINRLVFIMSLAVAPCLQAGWVYEFEGPGGIKMFTDEKSNGTDVGYRMLRRFSYQQTALKCARLGSQLLAKRVSSYDDFITTNSLVYNIEKPLVMAVIHVESCFDAKAVSRAGARGLMQLMPATAERYGVTEIHDPMQNIRGGVRYLSDLMKMWKKDTRLVLASYNAGENAVKKYKGIPPYKETQGYVKKVLEYYEHYKIHAGVEVWR